MSQKSDAVQQARKELIQQTLDKIHETRDFRELKRSTVIVLPHLWLHNIAKEEGLFKLEDWAYPQLRDQLVAKIEIFVIRHI